MKKNEFDEMEEIRIEQDKCRKENLEKYREIEELNDEKSLEIFDLENDYKLRKTELMNDKDLRKENGFSNQKDWGVYIDTVLLEYDKGIVDIKKKELRDAKKEIEKEIELNNILIENNEWKLKNRYVYYLKQSEIEDLDLKEVNI